MSWVKDFREFANDTSAHGVKYIFEGPLKILKMFFLLTWLAFSIYASYVIVISIVKFVGKPTGTKYEVIVESAVGDKPQRIKFPTITICSQNKVKKSFLDDPANAELKEYHRIIDKYDQGEAEKLAKRFADPSDDMNKIKNITYEELIADGGPNLDRLLDCSQRAVRCNMLSAFEKSDVAIMENSITGRCWRVNPDGNLMGKMGDYGKLKLLMFADIQDYSETSTLSEAQGFTVAFHDNNTFGSTLSSGFLMSPGTFYKVDLRLKKETFEPPPGGSCNASIGETLYGAYTEGSCILQCKDEYLREACGCVNVVPPLDHDGIYRSCTLEEWTTCGLPTYMEWYNKFTDAESTEPFCSCQTACEETRYEAQVSSSTVSKAYAKSILPGVAPIMQGFSNADLGIEYSTVDDIVDNLMVLEVLFTSMQTSEIKQMVTYVFANLLGDIGGVLGLFLGASLFTILEFLQFVFLSIGKYCCNWGRGKKDEDDLMMSEKQALAN